MTVLETYKAAVKATTTAQAAVVKAKAASETVKTVLEVARLAENVTNIVLVQPLVDLALSENKRSSVYNSYKLTDSYWFGKTELLVTKSMFDRIQKEFAASQKLGDISKAAAANLEVSQSTLQLAENTLSAAKVTQSTARAAAIAAGVLR